MTAAPGRPIPAVAAAPLFSWRRVYAMVLRHVYLMRGSWSRLAEMVYWPLINVIIWGFITQFMVQHSDWVSRASGVFLGGIMLWDVMFRGNLGVALSFIEEMWSRNLGHLSVSPLRPIELVASMLIMGLLRTLIGVTPVALLAIPLYHYSIFSLGLPLLVFFANLMMTGWAVGLVVSALVLRYGLGAESLAWVLIIGLAPLCGIYYPISVLPSWLQDVAWGLAPSHVFEGMRTVMFGGPFPVNQLILATGLNLVYVAGAVLFFLHIYQIARVKGLFLGMGE
jgi:ABC-2 type transport system permease protein